MSFYNPHEDISKHLHNLPHWQQGETWIFLTYRLADSLPKSKLVRWKEERAAWLKHHPQPWDAPTEKAYHQRFGEVIDELLDQGYGSCVLKESRHSEIVASAFHHFDGDRYHLAGYVVMPNHVHALFRPLVGHALPDIVRTWKRFTAREINRQRNGSGPLWQADYWDRLIRSRRHYSRVLRYIENNPRHLRPGTYRLWFPA